MNPPQFVEHVGDERMLRAEAILESLKGRQPVGHCLLVAAEHTVELRQFAVRLHDVEIRRPARRLADRERAPQARFGDVVPTAIAVDPA